MIKIIFLLLVPLLYLLSIFHVYKCQDLANLELLLRPHQLLRYMCGVADDKLVSYSECSYPVMPQVINRSFRKCVDTIYGPSSSESYFSMRRAFCAKSSSYWSQERELTSCLDADELYVQELRNPPPLADLMTLQSCLKKLTN